MYHSQVNENKYEIDRLNRELQELRKRYYDNKKRESASSINVKKCVAGFYDVLGVI